MAKHFLPCRWLRRMIQFKEKSQSQACHDHVMSLRGKNRWQDGTSKMSKSAKSDASRINLAKSCWLACSTASLELGCTQLLLQCRAQKRSGQASSHTRSSWRQTFCCMGLTLFLWVSH